eukprot:4099929-Prymnesium_polylepis.1
MERLERRVVELVQRYYPDGIPLLSRRDFAKSGYDEDTVTIREDTVQEKQALSDPVPSRRATHPKRNVGAQRLE